MPDLTELPELLKIRRIITTSSDDETNTLLTAGCKLLAVHVESEGGTQTRLLTIGIPAGVTGLPGWAR